MPKNEVRRIIQKHESFKTKLDLQFIIAKNFIK